MAVLTVQDIVRAGLQATYTAVAAHTFVNDGRHTFIHVVNGATAMNVTLVTDATADGLAISDRVVVVGSSEDHFIGPLPSQWYGVTGSLTFSDVTDGTVAVLKLPLE